MSNNYMDMNNDVNNQNDRISKQTNLYFEKLRNEKEEKEVECRFYSDFLSEAEKLNPRQIGYNPTQKAKALEEFKGYNALITGKAQNGKIIHRDIYDCAKTQPKRVGLVFLKEVKSSRKKLENLLK